MKQVALLSALLCLAAPSRAAQAETDRFAAGFAAGLLSAEFGIEPASVSVEAGTMTITAPGLGLSEHRSAARALLASDAIAAVRFAGDDELYSRPAFAARRKFRAFPRRLLFAPLLADPRWPHFSGTVQRHFRSNENLVWSGNAGESFAFIGAADWQFGLQVCIFSQFDMKARHDDQMTDDYLVGLPYSWTRGRATWMARLYHISTHTGDEFLLHHPGFNRVKISVEGVDVRVSYDLGGGWRAYGGPGYLYRRFPLEMKPLLAQGGLEYLYPGAWWRGLLRPVFALDLQKHQEYGWGATNIAARAGFQIEHRSQASRRVLVLLEYYRGRDVNGQFYINPDESLGLGLHLYF